MENLHVSSGKNEKLMSRKESGVFIDIYGDFRNCTTDYGDNRCQGQRRQLAGLTDKEWEDWIQLTSFPLCSSKPQRTSATLMRQVMC